MQIVEARLQYSFVELGEIPVLSTPADCAKYLRSGINDYFQQETFWVVPMDRKNRPLCRSLVTLGTATSTLVHPREVLRACILAGAAAAVVGHNHPSGDPAPSAADVRVTRTLREAFRVLEIDLLDHVIVGEADRDPLGLGYYSFRDAGVL